MDVLIVGSNSGTGGIQRYIDEQQEKIDGAISFRVYDTEVSDGSGIPWLLRAVAETWLGWLRFPFRRRPDIAHVHTAHAFSFYRAAFYVLVISLLWRRPVVLHIHGSSFDAFVSSERRVPRLVQRVVYRAADRIVVLSPWWADVVGDLAPREKLTVVENAVDPDDFQSDGTGTPHVVFVSHLIERKGTEEFVTAIDSLLEERSDVRVTVCGAGPLAPRVESLAANHEAVTYRGYVSEEAKRAILRDGTIYVLPTHAEGLPIAILEAMAAGNAIVATTVGAIPELVGADNGVLVAPGDAASLRDAIEQLLDTPDRVEQMGEANRRLVEERYSWAVVGEKMLGIYRDLVD